MIMGYLWGIYQGGKPFSRLAVALKGLVIRQPHDVSDIPAILILQVYHAQNFRIVLVLKIAIRDILAELGF